MGMVECMRVYESERVSVVWKIGYIFCMEWVTVVG